MGRKPWQVSKTPGFDDTGFNEFLTELPSDNSHGIMLDELPNPGDMISSPFKTENALTLLSTNDNFDLWNSSADWNSGNSISHLDVLSYDDQQRNEDSDSYSMFEKTQLESWKT
jgi:hypothetical protein